MGRRRPRVLLDGVRNYTMRCFVSWLLDDGTPTEGVEWHDTFDDALPVVGDRLVQPFLAGDFDIVEVVERYVYFDEQNDSIFHLIFKRTEIASDRLRALRFPVIATEPTGS